LELLPLADRSFKRGNAFMKRNKSEIPYDQRQRVLKRDNYRCVLCWRHYGLHIHHHDIFDPPEFMQKVKGAGVNDPYLRTEDWDLVTLCATHHKEVENAPRDSLLYKTVSQYLIRQAEKQVKAKEEAK
jgi:5-methylcytosine-specific restriction endonuclease McrA